MYSTKYVGLFVRDEKERSLLTESIRECGLEPVDLPGPTDPSAIERGPNSVLAADGESILVWGSRRLRVIVTDDESAIDGQRNDDSDRCWGRQASLVLILRGGDLQEERRLGTAEASGANATGAQLADSYPWVIWRPLELKAVTDQLRKAAHASLVFAERDRAVLEEVRRARSVLESMSNGVTISDANQPDHPLIYVNPAFERMTGYSFSECVGRNTRFLQGSDIGQPDLPKIREALKENLPVRALLRNYRKDGTAFWNELYMAPIADEEGQVTHFTGFQNDVTARVEAAIGIEHLASHDALTGLANRVWMMERLRQALPRSLRLGNNVAVLFFDLNNFKYVNDTFGHEAGDNLLREVAERLKAETREGETVARLGGDEFIAVLEDIAGEDEAMSVLERMSTRLRARYELASVELCLSASVGLAMFPRDGDTAEALLKAADNNMYLAKQDFHRKDDHLAICAADCL